MWPCACVPRTDSVLSAAPPGPCGAQSSNIFPILRELEANLQYQYLQSLKSIFSQVLRRSSRMGHIERRAQIYAALYCERVVSPQVRAHMMCAAGKALCDASQLALPTSDSLAR